MWGFFTWPYKWVCPATLILCNILCLSFLPLQHSEAERWRETGSVYSSRQWWSLWHTVVTSARKVRVAGKQTDSDTKKYGCSILEKKRGLSPWTGKNAYVVFCRKKGCQEIFNINNRWKYLQTSKIWRLQKATISSGHQLCGLKWKEDSSRLRTMNSDTAFTTLNSRTRRLSNQLRQTTSITTPNWPYWP